MRPRKISARESTIPHQDHSLTCSQDKTISQDLDSMFKNKNTYSEQNVITMQDDEMNIYVI